MAAADRAPERRADSGRKHRLNGVLLGVSAVGGLVVAGLAALESRMVWRPGPPGDSTTVPWGLVLGVAGSVAAVLLARAVSRQHGFAAAAGWIVGLLAVLAGGRGESYVIASDGLGYGFLVAATGATVVAASLVPGRR